MASTLRLPRRGGGRRCKSAASLKEAHRHAQPAPSAICDQLTGGIGLLFAASFSQVSTTVSGFSDIDSIP